MAQNSYGPSVPLCRLYERISKNGNYYLSGRLGAAKIVVLKSSDMSDDGAPIWNVLLSEAPAKPQGERASHRTARSQPNGEDAERRSLDPEHTMPDDDLAF